MPTFFENLAQRCKNVKNRFDDIDLSLKIYLTFCVGGIVGVVLGTAANGGIGAGIGAAIGAGSMCTCVILCGIVEGCTQRINDDNDNLAFVPQQKQQEQQQEQQKQREQQLNAYVKQSTVLVNNKEISEILKDATDDGIFEAKKAEILTALNPFYGIITGHVKGPNLTLDRYYQDIEQLILGGKFNQLISYDKNNNAIITINKSQNNTNKEVSITIPKEILIPLLTYACDISIIQARGDEFNSIQIQQNQNNRNNGEIQIEMPNLLDIKNFDTPPKLRGEAYKNFMNDMLNGQRKALGESGARLGKQNGVMQMSGMQPNRQQ